MLAPAANAHVEYVVDTSQGVAGPDWIFLASALADPLNIVLIILTVAIVLTANFVLPRISFAAHYLQRINTRAQSYTNLRSWILRLSLGIALIGAGFSQALISPVVDISHWPLLATIEAITGFLLLAGFLLGPASIGVMLLYFYGLFQNSYLIGNIETLAAAVALLALANARPGIDNLLGIPSFSLLKSWRPYVPLILRCGIGFALFYLAAYEKMLNPQLSALVVAQHDLQSVFPVSAAMWVLATGIIELILGVLLIVGYRVRTVAAVTVMVLALTFFYFGEEVYSHVTLFGVLSILFITGAGPVSIDTNKLQQG